MKIWQNDKMKNGNWKKMAEWQYGNMTKWHIDKMPKWQNHKMIKQTKSLSDKSTKRKIAKCQNSKTAKWQNGKTTKWQIDITRKSRVPREIYLENCNMSCGTFEFVKNTPGYPIDISGFKISTLVGYSIDIPQMSPHINMISRNILLLGGMLKTLFLLSLHGNKNTKSASCACTFSSRAASFARSRLDLALRAR